MISYVELNLLLSPLTRQGLLPKRATAFTNSDESFQAGRLTERYTSVLFGDTVCAVHALGNYNVTSRGLPIMAVLKVNQSKSKSEATERKPQFGRIATVNSLSKDAA